MRHLLTHTGGFVGDWFDDTGWGDDAVARYVAGLGELRQLTPLGQLWAYNNAGFAIAGLVVERVTGERFEDVVKRLVLDPLELESTTYWPWEVMTERFVVGHDENGVARPWPVGRSAHPAGGLTSTTGDLLRYARLHLDPPPELAPMQEKQADTAEEGEWVGLTWYGEDRHGTIRHGGGTVGQLSVLVLQPSTGYALAVLTNHSPAGQQVIMAALDAAGFGAPDPEPFPDAPIDDYAGTYESIGGRATFTRAGDRMRIDYEPLGGFPSRDSPAPPAPPPMEAFFYTRDRWTVDGGAFKGLRGHFLTTSDGARWMRLGGRLYARAD
jgi:CubicO group peptidase (beta-lactamase class C family)